MPYTFTAAHSSRITKSRQKKPPVFNRREGVLVRNAKIKTATKLKSKKASSDDDSDDDEDGDLDDRLDDKGLVKSLATELSLRDVVPTINYVCANMFDQVPKERSGMGSTRVAEVLNFQKRIPPIVTNAHVHALVGSPTSVEKEVSKLANAGLVKRVSVPGRGSGASSFSDGLVLVEDWIKLVGDVPGLDESTKQKYVEYLKSSDHSTTTLRNNLTDDEATALMRAGFLTASSSLRSSSNTLASQRNGTIGTLTSIHSVSQAASGSLDAVGGRNSVLGSGGGGSAGLTTTESRMLKGSEMRASLPNTGTFLKLVENARDHILLLLSKSKHKEAPLYLLRERWDGNVNTKTPFGRSKDPFSIVLPGKTRKWKEYYGLKFDWALAECLGAGQVEVFETGSVGLGVRSV